MEAGRRLKQAVDDVLAYCSRLRGAFVGLRFSDAAQEQRFIQARDKWLQPRILPIVLLIACVFMAFMVLDRALAPQLAASLARARIGTALVLISIGLVSRLRPGLVSMTTTTTLIAAVIYVGVFLTRVVVGVDSAHRFTEAIMLIQIGTWFLGGMTFVVASMVNSVALLAYLFLEVAVVKAPIHDVWQSGLYVGSLGLVAGFAAYNIELLFRRNFASNELLAAQRLEYQSRAMRDGLTGLWNRAAMEERVAAACRRTGDTGLGGAVFMVDLDRFKPVNDHYGHQAGDEVLIAIARRIQSVLRPSDSVGRIGGDEFLVLVEDLPDADFARLLAERVRGEIESPIRVRLHGDSASVAVSVGASIGIGSYSGVVIDPDQLVHSADLAMYQDKAHR